MKKSSLPCAALSVAALSFHGAENLQAGPVFEEPPIIVEESAPVWGAELSFGWDSQYIFRGVKQIDGSLVWTDLAFTAAGFTVGTWFAEGVRDDFNELNVLAAYTYETGPVALTAGYIFYNFPKDGGSSTHEIFAGVEASMTDWLTPALYYYHDFGSINGGYLEATLSGDFEIVPDRVGLSPFVGLSASFQYNSDKNTFNAFEYGLEVPIYLSNHIVLTGYFAGSVPMNAISGFETNHQWAGASITFTF